MSGIFPQAADGGVPAEAATNGYQPTNPPTEGSALYFGNGCGVVLRPEVLNSLTSEIACAVDKAGRNYDPGDTCNLFRAIMDLITASQRGMPIFPEILETNNVMTINAGTGLVTVPDGQVWRHRGVMDYDSTNIPLVQRQFATIANTVYHLRWYAPGLIAPVSTSPSGVIVLHAVVDPVYNPSSLAESNEAFDSTYDNVLIARVVTNAGNVPTVTALMNKANHRQFFTKSTLQQQPTGGWGGLPRLTATLNWARTPFMAPQRWSVEISTDVEATCNFDSTVTRYSLDALMAGYVVSGASAGNYVSGSMTLGLWI